MLKIYLTQLDCNCLSSFLLLMFFSHLKELQRIEQSNSSLQNEIAGLQKTLQRYTKALARHEPYCCLRASASTSRKHVPASHSGGCQSTSGPPPRRFAPQAPSSIRATPPLISSSLGLQAHLLSSASPQTFSQSSGLSAKRVLPSYSGPAALPYSVPDRHSLFRKEPPNTTSPTGVTPLCTRLLSTSITSSILPAAAQPQSGRDIIHGTSSVPANPCFPPLDSGTCDAFLLKQTSVVPPYQHLTVETRGPVFQAGPMNVPQLPLGQHSGNPNGSSPLLPPTLRDPAVQSPQANFELSHAAASFGYRQQTPNQESLLSLLTIPSPLTSSSSNALVFQPPPSQPWPSDPSSDLSLSELLEINDWILSGPSDQ